jgi:hypothetical protein
MSRYPFAPREHSRRFKLVINLFAGFVATLLVGIFATAKFAEGAWLVVAVFPALVFGVVRPNRRYRAEASVLQASRTGQLESAKRAKHRVFVFVDSGDLAEVEAVRYGQRLQADDLTAVHFVLDPARAASLQGCWARFEHGPVLQMVECPDRRLSVAAQELVRRTLDKHADTRVTVLLAGRRYAPLVGRLLHDCTAEKLARSIGRIPGATPQIVVYDVDGRIAHTRALERDTWPTSQPDTELTIDESRP